MNLTDWDLTQEDRKRACCAWWIKKTPEQRAVYKKQYEDLLAQINGTYDPGHYTALNVPKGKRIGDRREAPTPMPWMREAYETGYAWLCELIDLVDKPLAS